MISILFFLQHNKWCFTVAKDFPETKALVQAEQGEKIYSSMEMQNIYFLKEQQCFHNISFFHLSCSHTYLFIFEVVFVHYNHTILGFLSCSIAFIFIDQNKTGYLEHSCPLFAWKTSCSKVSFPDGKIIHPSTNLHSYKPLHTAQEKAKIEYYDEKIIEDVNSICHMKMPFPIFSPKIFVCTMQIR